MKKKRIVRMFLGCILALFLNAEIEADAKAISEEENGSIKIVEDADEEMEAESIYEMPANVTEKVYTGESYVLQEMVSAYSEERDSIPNTDPNYAYIVSNDTVMQGIIEEEEEARWYAFSLDKNSSVSILLQMEENIDADLYIFSLNEETHGLELIGGSNSGELGASEYFRDVMNAGTYLFAVRGYQGVGAFAFAFYESSIDSEYEVNDFIDTAAEVSLSQNVIGVIDSPYDVDYYSFTVSKPTILRYTISTEKGYSLVYAGKSGSQSSAIVIDGTLIKVQPGTYCFAVYSSEQAYSVSDTYTVNFKKVGEFVSENLVPLRAICEEAGVVFQTNYTGTSYYVNGNCIKIDYRYSYSSNTADGSQNYNITLTDGDNVYCQVWHEQIQGPEVVEYIGSTRPNKVVESKPLLQLMFYNLDKTPFYNISCVGTGAYAANTLSKQPDYVIVQIDPDDGVLVDIAEYNYFYQWAQGSNYISYFQPYTMIFNYNYFDFVN